MDANWSLGYSTTGFAERLAAVVAERKIPTWAS